MGKHVLSVWTIDRNNRDDGTTGSTLESARAIFVDNRRRRREGGELL